ncbi:beta-lactamase/transpeptidase-like protein [Aspergillus uvarum CBS 121591]|uniref:Beta-lactamase/transpeptidase-like protein n=1 Tax=Aspergillus uvarum CBS 121591 TaxID=1448315 RepID=A0A319CB57_9EURO|nr:beta-lactamase/transpeptidase-like protein [Aspergillus uvarum CBS 121591]PYH82735.1 beta-lactamase/transpeptidase-like protein [Aspergillus uvarum CBS 121591]
MSQTRSLNVDFTSWTGKHLEVTEGLPNQSTLVYAADLNFCKPHMIFQATGSARLPATVNFHSFSRSIDVSVNGHQIAFKPHGVFKYEASFQSPALNGRVLTWKNPKYLNPAYLECRDEHGAVVATFIPNRGWTMTKAGRLELDLRLPSGPVTDEVVVTGLALAYYIIVQTIAARGSATVKTVPMDIIDYFQSTEFSDRVKRLLEERHVPGLALAITDHGRIASAGYGSASLDPPQPCTPDSLFDIASASKSLTAASVALLVEDDKQYPEVQYEAPMSALLPDDFVLQDAAYTAGRTDTDRHDFSYLSPRASAPDTARSVTRNLRHLPLAAPLRSKFIYCNMMYTVATHLVEEKTGLPFADFLEDRVFRPLGMASTNLQPQRARDRGLTDRIATGYGWNEEQGEHRGFQTPDCPEAQGAGSIITSVNDYIRWVKAMMHRQGPVTESLYKGLLRPRSIQDPGEEELAPQTSFTLYAAGWEIYHYRGHAVVSHDGAVAGFGSTHFFLPGSQFGAVILGNSDTAIPVVAAVARELIDQVLQVPHAERPDWNSIEWTSWEKEDSPSETELREKLCPDMHEPEPQQLPLSAYTGQYKNLGYHELLVEANEDRLFVDATDRSFGFVLTFNHVGEQSKYIARLKDYLDGFEISIAAEFALEDGKAVSLGLGLEEEMEDLVWFAKVEEGDSDA